jgi:pyruvate dehydrogenase E2 component (dihydrolipoamide acetyltransferase)
VNESNPSARPAEPPSRTAKGASERTDLSKREQAAARRAAESKATIPHLYAHRAVELEREDALTPAVAVHAAARALRAEPALNGVYRDGALESHSRVNVCLTVESDDGSLAPTLFDADTKSVEQIEAEIAELTDAARAGTLTAPAFAGGTFTVSAAAPGAAGMLLPVVVGQSSHLVLGAARRTVVVGPGGDPVGGWTAELSLSCDARAVQPAQAAAFLAELAATIG